jgi:hypothetical protein
VAACAGDAVLLYGALALAWQALSAAPAGFVAPALFAPPARPLLAVAGFLPLPGRAAPALAGPRLLAHSAAMLWAEPFCACAAAVANLLPCFPLAAPAAPLTARALELRAPSAARALLTRFADELAPLAVPATAALAPAETLAQSQSSWRRCPASPRTSGMAAQTDASHCSRQPPGRRSSVHQLLAEPQVIRAFCDDHERKARARLALSDAGAECEWGRPVGLRLAAAVRAEEGRRRALWRS